MHMKSYLMEDKVLFILHTQYHGCWWPGNARSQGINSHGIDLCLRKAKMIFVVIVIVNATLT